MKTKTTPSRRKPEVSRSKRSTKPVHPTATTLAIDIGGAGLKAAVLNNDGKMITERLRVRTPPDCPPDMMVKMLAELVAPFKSYDRVSVGFPGVVRRGKILTAPNLGTEEWKCFDLDLALTKKLGKPVRVLNDADIQGLGAIQGKGVEMVITLGTGLGSVCLKMDVCPRMWNLRIIRFARERLMRNNLDMRR